GPARACCRGLPPNEAFSSPITFSFRCEHPALCYEHPGPSATAPRLRMATLFDSSAWPPAQCSRAPDIGTPCTPAYLPVSAQRQSPGGVARPATGRPPVTACATRILSPGAGRAESWRGRDVPASRSFAHHAGRDGILGLVDAPVGG